MQLLRDITVCSLEAYNIIVYQKHCCRSCRWPALLLPWVLTAPSLCILYLSLSCHPGHNQSHLEPQWVDNIIINPSSTRQKLCFSAHVVCHTVNNSIWSTTALHQVVTFKCQDSPPLSDHTADPPSPSLVVSSPRALTKLWSLLFTLWFTLMLTLSCTDKQVGVDTTSSPQKHVAHNLMRPRAVNLFFILSVSTNRGFSQVISPVLT